MWKFDILSAKSISVTKIKWKWCPIHWNWPNIANSGKFPDIQKISWKKSRKILRFDILSAKSISVTEIKWKWCPIHRNWWKKANSGEFPDFQNISGKNPEKWEMWNSEFKIKFCDLNWVRKIPNILELAQTSQFPGISRFPDFQFPDSRKIGNLKFWVQNQAQWCKLSGKNMQHIEIGQN